MSNVIVVIGAGSIGQAITRRVSVGKHVLLADLRSENAEAAATSYSRWAFLDSPPGEPVVSLFKAPPVSRKLPSAGASAQSLIGFQQRLACSFAVTRLSQFNHRRERMATRFLFASPSSPVPAHPQDSPSFAPIRHYSRQSRYALSCLRKVRHLSSMRAPLHSASQVVWPSSLLRT
jgi:hypothetical protein